MKILALLTIIILVSSLFTVTASAKLTQDQQAKNRQAVEDARNQMKEPRNATKQFAQSKYKMIAVILDKICLNFIKNNITNNKCPPYNILEKWDTTNQKYSGKFVTTKGFYHRDKPQQNNHWINYKDEVVCVDCSRQALSGSRVIQLVTKLDYIKREDNTIYNATRFVYHQRGVDDFCSSASIVYTPFLLQDTIDYLKSGCSKTEFVEKQTIVMNLTQHDISTTKAWQYQKWLAEMKVKCKKKC